MSFSGKEEKKRKIEWFRVYGLETAAEPDFPNSDLFLTHLHTIYTINISRERERSSHHEYYYQFEYKRGIADFVG